MPPLSGSGRASSASSTALLSFRPGRVRKTSARWASVQVEGFWPKATFSMPARESSRRARICSREPLASVSIGWTRPPLCTGISPKTRLSQAESAACAGRTASSRAAAEAAVLPRPPMKRASEKPNCQSSPIDMMSTEA